MPSHKSPQSQKLIKLIGTIPFAAEDKTRWESSLQENGITPELAEEIHQAVSDLPAEKFANEWQKAKDLMAVTTLFKQWRMSEASKNFRHNR
jgi:hypothetical protein